MTRISWETATAFDVVGNVPYRLKDEIHSAMKNHELAEGYEHEWSVGDGED